MTIKSLNLTSIYSYAEKASGQKLTDTIMAYGMVKNGTVEVEYDMIEDVMARITSRTSPFFAKYAIDKMVKSRKIQIVFNDSLRLTNAIPFFRKQENGQTVTVVNITNFATMTSDGTIRMNDNTLYAMLLSAALSLELENNILSYARDAYIMYARLFTNIVSNLVAYMDQVKKEKIQYLASNFFYYNVYGPNRTFQNPYLSSLKYNSKEAIIALDGKFQMYGEDSAYESLEIFIQNLNKVFPEMQKLTFKNFIDRWSASYGSSTLFASEYLPFFFYMIISTACMSNTVNVNKISTEISMALTSVYKRIEKNVNDMND